MGDGPLDAEIVLIGESVGDRELKKGLPFVGPTGSLLMRKMDEVGIFRSNVRLDNVVQVKPPGGTVAALYLDGNKRRNPSLELREWFDDCRERIKGLSPNVLVAVGEVALQCLTGLQGITRWQCSILESFNGVKTIPLIHPSAVLRSPDKDYGQNMNDLQIGLRKVAEEAKKPDTNLPVRNYVIEPTLEQTINYLHMCRNPESTSFLSIDIETVKGAPILLSIAIAPDPMNAICIPFAVPGGSYWMEEDEVIIWKELYKTLNGIQGKIFQNFIFDTLVLAKHGLPTRNLYFDTMLAEGVMYSELRKGLHVLARKYTREPYWKDDRKEWAATAASSTLWAYNAKDAAVTYEIAMRQLEELERTGMKDYFFNHTMKLCEPVYNMCVRGMRIDAEAYQKVTKNVRKACTSLEDELSGVVGGYINVASPKQVKEYFVKKGYKLERKKTAAGIKETTDKTALVKMRKKYPGDDSIRIMLDIREKSKLLSSYLKESMTDSDGRLRSSCNVEGTETGRFSVSMTAWKTGFNTQTMPPDIRNIVIPDKDMTLVSCDLERAEYFVVAWLSGDPLLTEELETGVNLHHSMGSQIAGYNIDDIKESDPEKYQKFYDIGKRTNHGHNYSMGTITFQDYVLKETGIILDRSTAKRYLELRTQRYPYIRSWHQEIKEEVTRTRCLTNPFGRKRWFFGRVGDYMFREAYAFLPQSTVTHVIKIGLLNIYEKHPWMQLLQEGHDSLLYQVPADREVEALKVLGNATTVPFDLKGKERVIPVSVYSGPNWRDLKEPQNGEEAK